MRFQDALGDLDGRQSESKPGPSLDRIRELVNLLDHPELTYPSIHVTGTNGKTTTTRMVAGLACAHGLSAGAFISPHLASVRERLSVCGEDITGDQFAEEYQHLMPFFHRVDPLTEIRVTYFEALTALAYVWFADKPVGLGVFEVGMGGTWDATNLIRGDVAVLCPIGVDHRELGSTPAETAVEKSGIIKEGRRAVVREQRPEVLEVVRARADRMGAELLLEGRDFELASRTQGVGGQSLSVRGLHDTYENLFLPMFGEQLSRNAAAAIAAVEALTDRALDEEAAREALAAARSPGRLEVVARHPLVLLDGAHNTDAAGALVQAVAEAFRWERLHLVLGVFADKDVEALARILVPLADRIYACRNSSPRAAPVDRVEDAVKGAGATRTERFDSVPEAVAAALGAAGERDLVLVTGSFYTVADARPLFAGT